MQKILTPCGSESWAARLVERVPARQNKEHRVATDVWVEGQKCLSIPLTKGKTAIIDEADRWIEKYHWNAQGSDNNRYSYRAVTSFRCQGKTQRVFMHHLILHQNSVTIPIGFVPDHANRNGLDNRRSNLRLATLSQSMANRNKAFGKSSKFRGVSRDGSRWASRICLNYKNHTLGSFSNEAEAAQAYDIAATLHFGEFAVLNFPVPTILDSSCLEIETIKTHRLREESRLQ